MQDNITKVILGAIAIGIWVLVFQNSQQESSSSTIPVRVVNTVDSKINDPIRVTGNVKIDNIVDVNLEEILGYKAGTRRSYTINGVEYNSLDVSPR